MSDVTVAVLTRNAGPILERLLHAVAEQETDRRVEVLAVDSGSSDGTLEVLQAARARVVPITPDTFNFGLARDRAFEEAQGAIVVSLSQDAVPTHGRWLENLIAPLTDAEVGASCGRSIPDPERPDKQFLWERNGYFYFTREMKKFAAKYGRGLSNSNSAIRREVWERLKFGEQAIGEDFRFQTKLHAEGLRVAFPDDAPVLHHHSYTLRSLAKRCRNEGLGLRELGCPYGEWDLVLDFFHPQVNWVWLRELLRGRIRNASSLCFPDLRPIMVYIGSRFGRRLWS